MPASRTTLLYKDVNGLVRPVDALDLSGAGSGPFQPIHQLADPTGTPVVPAQDGADGSGIAVPAGGTGIRGWLSGIYNVLATRLPALAGGRLPVSSASASNTPRVTAAGNLAASGDAVTLALDGMNTAVVQFAAGWGGGPVAFSASADGGATYIAVNMVPYGGGLSAGSASAGGLWEMACGGLTHLKVQATAAITGGPAAVLVAAGNGLKSLRVGAPASNPLPTTPGVGTAAEASTVPGSTGGLNLLSTQPAGARLGFWFFQNQAAASLTVVLDDGAGGNLSAFPMAPGAGAGQQGASMGSADTGPHLGRIRVYGPAGSQHALRVQ